MTIYRKLKSIETIEHNKPMFRHLNILNMTLLTIWKVAFVKIDKEKLTQLLYSRVIGPLYTPIYTCINTQLAKFQLLHDSCLNLS